MLCCANWTMRLQESRSSSATGFVERKVFLLHNFGYFGNSFRKAWESGSSGLSSFLGRWFSNTVFLHDVAIQLTFSLKVNWVFGQEEKVWSSCQALQVWKIIGFGQKITGHCFWEQSKLILRTAAGSKMVIRESGHSQNFNCNLNLTIKFYHKCTKLNIVRMVRKK